MLKNIERILAKCKIFGIFFHFSADRIFCNMMKLGNITWTRDYGG